jgi:NADPH-dependent ferric siderophore reductase
MPFALRRERHDLVRRSLRVSETNWVTPSYRRIVFKSAELAGFASTGADDHLRLFIGEHSREYTPVAWSDEALTLELVVHGGGLVSDWAAAAAVGDEASIGGPRGSLVVEGNPDWWLLAGDETALPAIRRHLAAVKEGVPVTVLLLSDHDHDLPTAGRLSVERVGSITELADALGRMPQPDGDGFAFVAAEQSIVKPARAVLVTRWGFSPDRIVVKGYWKAGESEYHAPH